jgi:hypothetical protein
MQINAKQSLRGAVKGFHLFELQQHQCASPR